MEHKQVIQHCIDYIETHIKTEITAAELAEIAGYSLFHFYRLFHVLTGFPVMQYILRRRLLHAVYSVQCGNNTGIQAALEYGFETYAGFYKAFVREFGCTPKEFITDHRAKRPYHPNLFTEVYMSVTHKKAAEILRHWNLENEPISDIYYIGTGERNTHAYYVGNRFVLKCAENLQSVKNNILLADALQHAGLCSAAAVRTAANEDFLHDGELFFYLTKRLPGTQTPAADYYAENGAELSYMLGDTLGRLHKALKTMELPVHESDFLQTFESAVLLKAKSVLQADDAFFDRLLSALQNASSILPRQIIHRDPNPGNIIRDGDTFGFIDFELSERSVRVFDPCYAATAILSESFYENDSEKLEKWISVYRNILSGYDRVVTLTPEERLAIPYILLWNQLICVAWFSEQAQYREQFSVNVKMTKWLIDRFDALQLT